MLNVGIIREEDIALASQGYVGGEIMTENKHVGQNLKE